MGQNVPDTSAPHTSLQNQKGGLILDLVKRKVARQVKFDSTEFLLLLSVTLMLLVYFAWQTNLLPTFLTSSILGVSTVR